ncbi:MAG: hypothetical protein DMF60_06760 [Acidobacteria bacterium]|nr:MAG: hypothetical protein DMF60_06760 [Acidobacteriota bacterium]
MPTIAAIDVGSNAIRLAIANANTDGGYQMVYSVREPVRLGQDVFTKGTISANTIDRTVQTFVDFKVLKLLEPARCEKQRIATAY